MTKSQQPMVDHAQARQDSRAASTRQRQIQQEDAERGTQAVALLRAAADGPLTPEQRQAARKVADEIDS